VSEELYRQRLALPAGTCPSVGIVGLATGGGFGLLSRKLGLTCDNLRSLEMIDADGKTLRASADENQDLFWACRGGGGGHFGIITALEFQVYPIDHVVIFSLRWPADRAKAVFKTWQAWAPHAVDELTCLLSLSALPGKIHSIRCVGEFIGDEAALRKVLRPITNSIPPELFKVTRLPYNKAVEHFAGDKAPPQVFFKAKSSYAKAPISDEGLDTLLRGAAALPFSIAVICDAYGGAINRVGADETAFFHRGGTLFSMQYYSQWSRAEQSASRVAAMNAFYDKVRKFVANSAYVNYCDLELHDWQEAYWGSNFAKLRQVKAAYDPTNTFRHAQSIPVG
jgi:FAD/FMN-containing dehydrogenase